MLSSIPQTGVKNCSSRSRNFILPVLCVVFYFVAIESANCRDENAPANEKTQADWWRPGNEMPFHVIDFVHGEREKGGGCPGVISKNTKSTVVEIWFRKDSRAAFKIAKMLSQALGPKADLQKYVVGFDISKGDFLQNIKSAKTEFPKTQFCLPRKTARRLFDSIDAKSDSAIHVFLIAQKKIKRSLSSSKETNSGNDLAFAKRVCSVIKAAIDMK